MRPTWGIEKKPKHDKRESENRRKFNLPGKFPELDVCSYRIEDFFDASDVIVVPVRDYNVLYVHIFVFDNFLEHANVFWIAWITGVNQQATVKEK